MEGKPLEYRIVNRFNIMAELLCAYLVRNGHCGLQYGTRREFTTADRDGICLRPGLCTEFLDPERALSLLQVIARDTRIPPLDPLQE